MKTICDFFGEQVQQRPESVAVSFQGVETTYRELDRQSRALAAHLIDAGLSRGDRVALLLGNSPEYVTCYLGVLRAGGVIVALNPETTATELRETLGSAAPTAVIAGKKASAVHAQTASQLRDVRLLLVDGGNSQLDLASIDTFPGCSVELLQQVMSRDVTLLQSKPNPTDLAQIIYTSGTTGRAKGVTLTHRNISANCTAIVDVLQLTADDSMFVTLPFYFSYGNSLLFTHLAIGGRLILASDFVFWNRALSLLEAERASGFAGVPSTFAMLVHKSDFLERRFSHLRYLTCAGGALSNSVIERIRAAHPSIKFYPMYGQTEATARLSILPHEEWSSKPGTIGRGLPGVELKVVDDDGRPVPPGFEGEIVARGENIMQGYWNDPQETAAVLRPEGLQTGDLARIDDDGYITIVGRKNDIIKSGAYRMHPVEIESIITAHPLVAEVAVVGIADEIWGERPVAFVVKNSEKTANPTDTLSAETLIEFCRGRLPRHKLIREVRFVEHLPKTSSGKVRREELRRMKTT